MKDRLLTIFVGDDDFVKTNAGFISGKTWVQREHARRTAKGAHCEIVRGKDLLDKPASAIAAPRVRTKHGRSFYAKTT